MIRNTVIRVDEEVLVSEKREKFNVIKAMGNFLKNRPAVGATLAAWNVSGHAGRDDGKRCHVPVLFPQRADFRCHCHVRYDSDHLLYAAGPKDGGSLWKKGDGHGRIRRFAGCLFPDAGAADYA